MRDLAIDLGTANTLVWSDGKGIVYSEPTVIALNTKTQAVLAVGNEAWQMIGRTPGYIVATRPLRRGAIDDFDITQRMIRMLFAKVGAGRFFRSNVVVAVPSAITQVERRAVEEAAEKAGARAAYLVEEPVAAAIGAGLPINEPAGNMVVDIGGGTSEIAVISLGGVVVCKAIRTGGFDIDAAISNYVRKEYTLAIGERTAEAIKIAIGSAYPMHQELRAEIRGRDLAAGLPRTMAISSEEIRVAIDEPVTAIVDAVKDALSQTPPELGQDIMSRGIFLTGGGALLQGLDRRLSQETDIPVHVTENALETVVQGAGKCLESLREMQELFLPKIKRKRIWSA
ncbi:MAG TPA: rod shape-determining protein [Actinomycetota bacterium]|nr:rod shape-determining protein [Actinomycetota bacterium]